MRHEPLTIRQVQDEDAALELHRLIAAAADRMGSLGRSPWLLAEAPNKFNDATQDDLWYAVQIGGAYWEQSHFFEGYGVPWFQEHSRLAGETTADQIAPGSSVIASDEIASARSVLRSLEKAGWRELAKRALEGYENLLCVAWQHGQLWLCRTEPVSGEGDAWIWVPGLGFQYFGMCCRLDEDVGHAVPIYFHKINRDCLDHLSGEARQYFLPAILDAVSHRELSSVVQAAAEEAAAVTDLPLVLASRGSPSSPWEGTRADWAPRLFWNGKHLDIDRLEELAPRSPSDPEERGRHAEEVYRLSAILERLEAADWRGLFGRCYGNPPVAGQVLALYVGTGYAILVRENTTFLVEDGRLECAGVGDFPECCNPEAPP